MNKEALKERALKLKEHAKNNKAAYIWASIALAAIALQQYNAREFYAFLEEKGIDPSEYLLTPDDYEEYKLEREAA